MPLDGEEAMKCSFQASKCNVEMKCDTQKMPLKRSTKRHVHIVQVIESRGIRVNNVSSPIIKSRYDRKNTTEPTSFLNCRCVCVYVVSVTVNR